MDLKEVFSKLIALERISSEEDGGVRDANTTSAESIPLLCVVLATDGVWDNWTYEDVTRFVMDSSCVGAVCSGPDGAHRVTLSFMQRNALYAKRNFGGQADNATGVIMYISPSASFPVADS
jgi:serine/threonine protein phosphatase PrpC